MFGRRGWLTLAVHLMPEEGALSRTQAGALLSSKSTSCWNFTGSCRGHRVFSLPKPSACKCKAMEWLGALSM